MEQSAGVDGAPAKATCGEKCPTSVIWAPLVSKPCATTLLVCSFFAFSLRAVNLTKANNSPFKGLRQQSPRSQVFKQLLFHGVVSWSSGKPEKVRWFWSISVIPSFL
jgi:hypothetical protein